MTTMKKLLFCAGILALAVSCTEELDNMSSMQQQEQAPGITFTATDALAPSTRGEFEAVQDEDGKDDVWYPFWSAETDMIKVYATKVTKNALGASIPGDETSPVSATEFDDAALKTTNFASYKATRSERYAYFTASNQADILDFKDGVTKDKPATFLAVYPKDVELSAGATPDWKNGFDFTLNFPNALTTNQEQTNTEGKGVYELNAKYAVATGYAAEDNKLAVGENVPLTFNRVLTGLVFRTKGVDAYTDKDNNIFGKLKTIKVVADGEYAKDAEGNYVKVSTGSPKAATKLAYDANSTVTVEVKADTSSIKETNYTGATGSETMTLNLGSAGLDWDDAARGYMIIKPVSHKDAATGQPWTEGFKISYDFDNIEFQETITTSGEWEAGKFVRVPALDINSYPYLVTKGTSNTRALIVNSGNFSDVFVTGGTTNIEWSDTQGNDPAITEFNRIIVNEGVTLTKEELGLLKNFTNLSEITLAENTTIYEGTFNASVQKNLKKINFPKVTTIEWMAFGEVNPETTNTRNMKLTDVILPSYKFENADIARSFLNKASLVNLDMSAVDAMNVGFPSTGFTLDGYTALTTVKVKNGVRLGANAFYGCKVLANIEYSTENGAVELAGTSVFSGCEALKTININHRDIKANSFNGCSVLTDVLYEGKQVIPTEVGLGAFQNCKALVEMDLSQIKAEREDGEATVGDNAFNGCTAFIGGTNEENKVIVRVGGKEIGENAFKGCQALQHIEFLNATTIGNGALDIDKVGRVLKQIQFDDKVVFSMNARNVFDDDMTTVDLFITPGQTGVNGNDLTVGSQKVTFKSIRDKATNN